MIQIFNKNKNLSIQIEEANWVQFIPHDYEEENPYVIIELRGFNFFHHAENCDDCGSFLNDLGTNTLDWFISFQGKTRRLDMITLGKKENENMVTNILSEFDTGSKLKLNLHFLPTDKKELALFEKEYAINEEFEKAAIVHRLINDEIF